MGGVAAACAMPLPCVGGGDEEHEGACKGENGFDGVSQLSSPTDSALGQYADLPDSASVAPASAVDGAASGLAGGAGMPPSFVLKVADEQGRMYRMTLSPPYTLDALRAMIAGELGIAMDALASCTLKFTDDEGDEVTLSSDEGLGDAIVLADACKWKALKLKLVRSAPANSAPLPGTAAAPVAIGTAPVAVASADATDGSMLALAITALALLGIGGFFAMRRSK